MKRARTQEEYFEAMSETQLDEIRAEATLTSDESFDAAMKVVDAHWHLRCKDMDWRHYVKTSEPMAHFQGNLSQLASVFVYTPSDHSIGLLKHTHVTGISMFLLDVFAGRRLDPVLITAPKAKAYFDGRQAERHAYYASLGPQGTGVEMYLHVAEFFVRQNEMLAKILKPFNDKKKDKYVDEIDALFATFLSTMRAAYAFPAYKAPDMLDYL